MKRLHLNPYLLLCLASLFWAGNMVMGRGLRHDLPPTGLSFWRWVVALLCVLIVARPHLRADLPKLRAAWKIVIFLGIFGVGTYNMFSYIALQYTTATSATLLNSFVPMVTIGLAFLFLGKGISRLEGLGVLVSMLGVLTLISQGSLTALLGLQVNTGDWWMLAAVLVWSIYTVGLQWRPQGIHPMSLLTALVIVGLVFMAPAYAWELASGRHINLHAASLAGIVYAGVFAAFLGFVCFNAGVSQVGAARGSLFIHLQPVLAALMSALILDESPLWYHYAGVVCVFGGIALTMARPAETRP